jgi:hypothetical protein
MASLYTCECCEFSWPLSKSAPPTPFSPLFLANTSSSILTTCPTSDLSIIGLQTYITSIQKLLAPSSNKCSILNGGTSTCIKDYGFPFVGTTAYNPLSLPAGEPGTEALSNTAGNAFTVFPSPTLTLNLYPAYTSTITAAPFEKSAGADGVEVQGSSIVGGGAGTTATGVVATEAGSAAATATKAGSGFKIRGNLVLLSIAVALVIVVL